MTDAPPMLLGWVITYVDDPHPDVDSEALRVLLRNIFRSAGGTHDDWDTFDQVMADQRRTAVLIAPGRTYSRT